MNDRDFRNVEMMREPDQNGGVLINGLKKIIEEKYKAKLNDYWELHKWSINHLAEFWSEFWDYAGIVYSKRFEQVIDLTVPMEESPEWFKGARLNFAENLLRYRDERVALITAAEDRESETTTFAEMFHEARTYAAAFRKIGVKKGDVVACYMSNRKEAIIAMQATTSIGAIWTGALPLLGPQAVINRFKIVNPKILVTVDRFCNDKEEVKMLPKVKEIVKGLPSIEKVVIVPSTEQSKLKDISDILHSCFLDDFLKLGINEDGTIPEMEFEQVSFSHPVFIGFTSGTTGTPKAITHGFGALIPTALNFWLQNDCDRECIWFSMSPVGWVSWSMIAPLTFGGSAIFLYEGIPFQSPTYFWELVEKHKLTNLFLPTKMVNQMEKLGYIPTDKNDLSCLKMIWGAGSIVREKAYDFFYKKVKKDVMFGGAYGCTEMMAICLLTHTTVPAYKGELPVAALGIDIQCLDETGKPVEGEVGELIIAKPSPYFLLGLWGDSDGSLRRKAYYSKFPGKFSIGDFGIINPFTKGYIICGRSDETLKQRGTRFGSSEIYNIMDMFSEIRDSICVSQYNKNLDERAVLMLQMRKGYVFNEDLVQRVRMAIKKELTAAHVPDVIIETTAIPYNLSTKKMEITVKNIINKRPYNADNIINPECLKNFCDMPELKDF